MVLSPSNKTASKEYPAPCWGRGVGCMERGQVRANILLRPALRICSKLNTFQIVHTVFGSLVISNCDPDLASLPMARAGAGI